LIIAIWASENYSGGEITELRMNSFHTYDYFRSVSGTNLYATVTQSMDGVVGSKTVEISKSIRGDSTNDDARPLVGLHLLTDGQQAKYRPVIENAVVYGLSDAETYGGTVRYLLAHVNNKAQEVGGDLNTARLALVSPEAEDAFTGKAFKNRWDEEAETKLATTVCGERSVPELIDRTIAAIKRGSNIERLTRSLVMIGGPKVTEFFITLAESSQDENTRRLAITSLAEMCLRTMPGESMDIVKRKFEEIRGIDASQAGLTAEYGILAIRYRELIIQGQDITTAQDMIAQTLDESPNRKQTLTNVIQLVHRLRSLEDKTMAGEKLTLRLERALGKCFELFGEAEILNSELVADIKYTSPSSLVYMLNYCGTEASVGPLLDEYIRREQISPGQDRRTGERLRLYRTAIVDSLGSIGGPEAFKALARICKDELAGGVTDPVLLFYYVLPNLNELTNHADISPQAKAELAGELTGVLETQRQNLSERDYEHCVESIREL
jgi:hypothetical protein